MKKKNIFGIVLAMALVAVVSVGATLAYLTAQTNDVKNTFKFAEGMEVELEEPTPTPTADVTIDPNDDNGFDYTNVVPGQVMDKNPRVYTTTPVDAYLFVKVTGASELMSIKDLNAGEGKDFKIFQKDDEYGNGVYYMEVEGKEGVRQGHWDVFTQVQVGDLDIEGSTEVTIDDILVQVYEIQKTGFENDVAGAEAQCKWNQTTTGGSTGGSEPVVDPNPAEEQPVV